MKFKKKDSFWSTLVLLNYRLAENSYSTSNFIYEVGTSFYFVCVVLILNLLGRFTDAIKDQFLCLRFCNLVLIKLWYLICPGLYLRTLIQLYNNVLKNSYITLRTANNCQKWGDYVVVLVAAFWGLHFIVTPFVYKIFKSKSAGTMHLKRTQRQFGELYRDFYRSDNTTSMMQLLY